MANKQMIDAMWDDSPVDVSTEVNFIWSIANKLRGPYRSDKYKDVSIMFDKFRLKDVLAHYKQNFVSTQWGNEKYKWEAVKWFQDNWDVNAQNFPEMLSRSLDKTFNLLASINNFPRRMIVSFSKAAPEEVRAMFIALFDENKDV